MPALSVVAGTEGAETVAGMDMALTLSVVARVLSLCGSVGKNLVKNAAPGNKGRRVPGGAVKRLFPSVIGTGNRHDPTAASGKPHIIIVKLRAGLQTES
jgi:hypothetical protein